jgi:hypothetical protein
LRAFTTVRRTVEERGIGRQADQAEPHRLVAFPCQPVRSADPSSLRTQPLVDECLAGSNPVASRPMMTACSGEPEQAASVSGDKQVDPYAALSQ